MKKTNKLTIVIAAILVVVAGVLIWNNRYLTTIQGEAADFQVWDTASVTKVYLADRHERESLLERQPDGSWMLNGTYRPIPNKYRLCWEHFTRYVSGCPFRVPATTTS